MDHPCPRAPPLDSGMQLPKYLHDIHETMVKFAGSFSINDLNIK